jgi:hypothetical protein
VDAVYPIRTAGPASNGTPPIFRLLRPDWIDLAESAGNGSVSAKILAASRFRQNAENAVRSLQIASKSLPANNLTAARQSVRIDELSRWQGRQHGLAPGDFSHL